MRICSFLPGATEILYELGLEDKIVGVSDDCHYPPEVRAKPQIVTCTLNEREYTAKETYEVESAYWKRRENIYKINEELLRSARPDLVIAQEVCPECAITPNELIPALEKLSLRPRVVSLSHKNLRDILDNVTQIGSATDRLDQTHRLRGRLQDEIASIKAMTRALRNRPRTLCISGLHPLLGGGYWVPEMVEIAGGEDGIGKAGENAYRIDVEAIKSYDPDVIVVMHCSYDLRRMARNMNLLTSLKGWDELRAVRTGNVHLVDSGSYFSCPGPRISQGIRILAKILHPELFTDELPKGSHLKFDPAASPIF